MMDETHRPRCRPTPLAVSSRAALPRAGGVLLHVTSLPTPYGIGDLGPAACTWIDLLADAKQAWWQILPLGPPGPGNSPYNAFSAFAGNPLLISPDLLVHAGLLTRGEAADARMPESSRVDFIKVTMTKSAMLRAAWSRFMADGGKRQHDRFRRFRAAHDWLDDFTLFMALKAKMRGADWTCWPADLLRREPAALRAAQAELREEINRLAFEQWLFGQQWQALRAHAHRRGVRIMGDMPIFVSQESADVWANPHLFLLDKKTRRPTSVAGVPPDYFSRTGQRWNNPLYDWRAMKADGYAWWVARAKAAIAQADVVRLDHFRGFAGFWQIPAAAKDARAGRWAKGPGMDLFVTLRKELGSPLPFIAEDLGVITPDVEQLRDALHLPGMRVLQFAFGGDAANPHLPHNYPRHTVAYTGTHDNDTTAGWWKTADKQTKAHARQYLPDAARRPAQALLQAVWSSVADTAIVPLQDLLNLNASTRMNTPGTREGNWAWRLTIGMTIEKSLAALGNLSVRYGRVKDTRRPDIEHFPAVYGSALLCPDPSRS